MDSRYERNVPALTEAECSILRDKRVLVVGCGGLGGYILELLARIGVGQLVAVDGDVFERSNLNRQLLSETDLLGAGKAEAAKARISRVNPDVQVQAVAAFLDESNASELVSGCDAVLDALDTISARKTLAKACVAANIPYVYGAVNGWVAQAAVSLPGDGLIETLYPAGAAVKNRSVLSFTPALCASMQAALCVKLLTGRPVETGTLYYWDLLNQEFETIPLT